MDTVTNTLVSKPKGKRKTQDPCLSCYLHKDHCICPFISPLETSTRLALIVHNSELKRTTNTGRIAMLALSNSALYIRGLKSPTPSIETEMSKEYAPLLLYPGRNSKVLDKKLIEQLQIKKPVLLIVPDGTWRQASKVSGREKALKNIPQVMLKPYALDQSRVLRKEHSPYGMATLQAIAMALSIIETEEIGNRIMAAYQLKLSATLASRGVK